MKLSCVLLLCCLALHSAFADETNLVLVVDGITYSNVTFGTVSPSAVSVRHSSGIASIPLAKLPPELQQRFGYDPQKAGQYLQADAQRRAAWQKSEQERLAKRAETEQAKLKEQANAEKCKGSFEFVATVVQVIPEGLLLRVTNGGNEFGANCRNDTPLNWVLIGHPQHQTIAEGNSVVGSAYRDGVFRYSTVLGASRTVERWVCCSDILKSQTSQPTNPFTRPKQRDPNIRRLGESP